MKNPFNLENNKLIELLNAFDKWFHVPENEQGYFDNKKHETEEIQSTFLNSEYIKNASDEELIQRIKDYVKKLEGPVGIRLGIPRIQSGLNSLKSNFKFLIESGEDPFGQAESILAGDRKIPIFARAFWSPIFQARHPELLPNWNKKTEKFLKKVGINITSSKLSVKNKYRLISDAFKYLQNLNNEYDFHTLNLLMHYGTEVDEGEKILGKMLGDENLAEPFSSIFTSRENADWAFDLLHDTLNRLGVNSLNDERYAITLRHQEKVLRLNFGNLAILQFYSDSHSQYQIGLALIDEGVKFSVDFNKWKPFANLEPSISVYELPFEVVKANDNNLMDNYKRALTIISDYFQNWKASNFRGFNQSEIAEALFDSKKKEILLRDGLSGPNKQENLNNDSSVRNKNPQYSVKDLSNETGIEASIIEAWIRAINRKGQAIFYGPPGTGKTYLAEKLSKHLIGGGDGLSDLVQFHPAYSYEDFIQGIRPISNPGGSLSYPIVPGRFLEFCKKSEKLNDTCVLIIDEVNRANLSRVFGELMYLLEYREREVPLASGGTLRVPQNVRIIGTMNTADRSIALVDHALRRRFAFLALTPNYQILRKYHLKTGFNPDALIAVLKQLNAQIGDPHYEIGISFFLRTNVAAQIGDIWRMEIEPYLEEYFFDQPERVNEFRWNKIQFKILP